MTATHAGPSTCSPVSRGTEMWSDQAQKVVVPPHSAVSRPGVVARILVLPIRAWRLLSVHLPPRCRFYPSCSQYALDAITLHGAGRGTWLAVRRVGRCHPWHDGGVDPVPEPRPNVRSLDAATLPAAEES